MNLYMCFRTTPYTYLGPTVPITWPWIIWSPFETIKFGETWQYEILRFSDVVIVMVYPPPPRKPTNVICPSHDAIRVVPSGAGISIPLWYVEAPEVGAVRFPKYDEILVYPGTGHAKFWFP